jgi:phosphoglycolate phosphatase-like HAD superfamily hydrolase
MTCLRTLIFDCDGVILDSNPVKTEAFRQVALPYGTEAAEALVRYHVEQGGVSRYRKFAHFLTHILNEKASDETVNRLSQIYSECVFQALLDCPLTPELEQLRIQTSDISWMIVSGGDEQELNAVFTRRGISHWFDAGIFGSPADKDEILQREFSTSGAAKHPALFIGDSRYDHEAAVRAGCDFVFASEWTEFGDWKQYCRQHGLHSIKRASDISAFIPQ